MLDEDDLANRLLDQLKEEGFDSLQQKERYMSFKRAEQEYESRLFNPYEY